VRQTFGIPLWTRSQEPDYRFRYTRTQRVLSEEVVTDVGLEGPGFRPKIVAFGCRTAVSSTSASLPIRSSENLERFIAPPFRIWTAEVATLL